jgi:hypothetical protein
LKKGLAADSEIWMILAPLTGTDETQSQDGDCLKRWAVDEAALAKRETVESKVKKGIGKKIENAIDTKVKST